MNSPESSKFLNKIRKISGAGALFLGSLIINGDQRYNEIIEMHTEEAVPFDEEDFTIMTANVHSWSYRGSDVMEDLRQILAEKNPDVVCLQEVTTRGEKLQALHKEGYNVLFAATYNHPLNGPFGNAVISKSPLKMSKIHSLPNPKTISPRNAIAFEVQNKQGRWLKLVNTHLSTNSYERQMQVSRLNRDLGERVLGICADANDSEEFIRGEVVALSNPVSFLQPSDPMPIVSVESFPSISPRRAIDMVIVPCGKINGPTRALEVGSDHLAVMKNIDVTNCNY